MNISEIKAELGIATLNLNTAKDQEGNIYKDQNDGEWMRHWDNDDRVEVSLAKDLFEEIKNGGNTISTLGLQKSKREAAKGELTSFRIVKYTPAEGKL